MAETDNEAIFRQMIEAENAGDYDRVYSFLADDFSYSSSDANVNGIDAVRDEDRPILEAFPDHHRRIEQLITKGDHVVARWRMTGTHQKPLAGIPATNRAIDVPGCSILEFKNAKVSKVWRFTDRAAILQQLGLLPSVAPDPGSAR